MSNNSAGTSGPAGMSDGVMTPRKKHRKSGKVLSAAGSQVSKDTVKRQCVEMSAKFKVHGKEMKIQTGFLHTGKEPQNHLSWSYPVVDLRIPRPPVHQVYQRSKNPSFPTCTSLGTGCPHFQSACWCCCYWMSSQLLLPLYFLQLRS